MDKYFPNEVIFNNESDEEENGKEISAKYFKKCKILKEMRQNLIDEIESQTSSSESEEEEQA
mgnify:CR=1 FL=1